MRLLILSDLHREIWGNAAPKTDLGLCRPDAVILAGDISNGTKGVLWAREAFQGLPVLYVAGNHEFYGWHMQTALEAIEIACQESDNIHFLNRSSIILNNVRFLGATLWTDFNIFGNQTEHMSIVENSLNDYVYVYIRFGDELRKITAKDILKIHEEDREFFSVSMSQESLSFNKTVCISHHLPSILSIPKRFKTDPVSAGYASHCDFLVSKADLWIHGHSHDSFDYKIEKCRVVSNPCGYPFGYIPENKDFNPNFIIEI